MPKQKQNFLKKIFWASWDWWKDLFGRTIGEQADLPRSARKKSPQVLEPKADVTSDAAGIAPAASKEVKPYKREWGPELYEYFVEHLLSIDNYDPIGLTEKLTIAWLTPTAKSLRKASGNGWGPRQALFSPYKTKESYHATCMLDAGVTLICLGLVIPLVKVWLLPLSLPLFYWGGYFVVLSAPEIDWWDGWFWSKTQTWDEIYQDYDNFHSLKVTKTLARVEPYGTDFLTLPVYTFNEVPHSLILKSPEIEWTSPEWLAVTRKKKINQTVAWLCNFIFEKKAEAQQLKGLLPPKRKFVKFSFKAWRDDVLLLEVAREPNGYGVHFISCAFLAPRSVDAREMEGWHWGPLYSIRWPFRSPGGPLRELTHSFFMHLIGVGLLSFYYTYCLGILYLAASFILLAIGVGGSIFFQKSVEDWFDEELFGGIPACYPHLSGAHSYKYETFYKEIMQRDPASGSDPSRVGLMTYFFFFSKFPERKRWKKKIGPLCA